MPKCCDRLIRNHKPHNHNKPKHTENTKKTRHTKTHLKNTTKYFKNAMKHEWVWLGTLRELWLWINIKRKCVPKINHSAIVRTLLSLSLSLSLSLYHGDFSATVSNSHSHRPLLAGKFRRTRGSPLQKAALR